MEVIIDEVSSEGVTPVKHELISELRIKIDSIESLVEELRTQEQKSLFWGGAAIRETERFNKFENIDLRKWRAHCNLYAKAIMKYRKDSMTIQGMQDVVAEIYSLSVMKNEELKLFYVEQVLQTTVSVKDIDSLKLEGKYQSKLQSLKEEMYSYTQSFEEIMEVYYDMQSDKELLGLVADVFKARSYSLSGIKQLTVGLEGEGFQVPRRTVEALENVAKKLEELCKKN